MKQFLHMIAQLLGMTQQESHQEMRTQRIPVRIVNSEHENRRFYR